MHWRVIEEPTFALHLSKLGDRDELDPCAQKADELKLLELRARHIDLERGVQIKQSAESQAEVPEPTTSANEVR